MVIAALYVAAGGAYYGLPDVDPWDEARDARLYPGPWPVVAHPPCQRWGRYWYGGPSCRERKVKGDDGGCFASALAAVRRWGGVLEHPESSGAWAAFGLNAPPRSGGWIFADFVGGWTCCVEQGNYGHAAHKATWLYAHGIVPPSLRWGRADVQEDIVPWVECPEGCGEYWCNIHDMHAFECDCPPLEEWNRDPYSRKYKCRGNVEAWMSHRQRLATPLEFRDLLLSLARSVRQAADAAEVAG